MEERAPPRVVKKLPAAQHAYINGTRRGGKKERADSGQIETHYVQQFNTEPSDIFSQ